MPLITAKDIIQKELSDPDLSVIEFHGGEPLLNFPLIRDLCEWFWQSFPEKKMGFFLTTNGTKFTEESFDWFQQHNKQITCCLSLDGNVEMNLLNRGCEISDRVLSFMASLWPHQSVKMTISTKTLPMLADGVIFAHEHDLQVSANLAYGINWRESNVEVYAEQLNILIEYYLKHPSITPCKIFDASILAKVLLPYSYDRHCGAGKTFKAYDTDGKVYPCHVFAGNTMETSRWEDAEATDFKDDKQFDDPECGECPIHNICPTCYGMNFIERGDVSRRDKNMCEFIKAEKLATCMLHKQKILSKDIDSVTEEEYLVLKAIQHMAKFYPELDMG